MKNLQVAIKKIANKPLSKNQAAFNKLTKKIEGLQIAIDKKKLQLDVAIDSYAKELYPATQNLQDNRKLYIIQLWQIYKNQPFAKTEQYYFKQYIQAQLDDYLDDLSGFLEVEMHQIFEEIEGLNYQQLVNEQKKELIKELKKNLAAFNVVVTKEDMQHVETLHQKLVEATLKYEEEEKLNKSASNKHGAKNRQQEKYLQEQADLKEAMRKSVNGIYKQLAKLIHPDGEQDAKRREEKEVLMKQLNDAYKNKDLHALLLLEVKWINNDKDHLSTLTNDTLEVYLSVLKEQIGILTEQKNNLIFQPQYRALEEKFGPQIVQYPVEVVQSSFTAVKNKLYEMKSSIDQVNSPLALRYVKSTLKNWIRTKKQKMEEEAMYNAFWYGKK